MRALALIIVTLGQWVAGSAPLEAQGDEALAVKVEFRRAENAPAPGLTKVMLPGMPNPIYVSPTAELTNADIAAASVAQTERGEAAIEIVFTDDGAEKMFKLTSTHLMKPLAILIDDKVTAAPRIVSAIRRKALISGHFSRAEAERIAGGILSKSAQ